jgi:hypothetical protein
MSIPISDSEVKKQWSNTSTLAFAFMAWCLITDGDKFTFGWPSIARRNTETGMM